MALNNKLLIGFFLIAFANANYNPNGNGQGQLPQLMNADGSLTSHNAHQAFDNNRYGNYYPSQQQQPYQNSFFNQAGNELKQTAHSMSNHLQNAGEALGNAPRNFVDNVSNMGHQISNSFDNMVQNGLNKLNDLKNQFGEKFRPLIDNALQIFQTPRSEKEKWNELVQRVESTNLSEQEKQQLYQRIADATSPQQSNNQQHH